MSLLHLASALPWSSGRFSGPTGRDNGPQFRLPVSKHLQPYGAQVRSDDAQSGILVFAYSCGS